VGALGQVILDALLAAKNTNTIISRIKTLHFFAAFITDLFMEAMHNEPTDSMAVFEHRLFQVVIFHGRAFREIRV